MRASHRSIATRPRVGPLAVNGRDPVAVWDFSGGILPAGFSLSRASAGYGWDASGNLAAYAANAARFDRRATPAIVLEPARTNLLTYSAARNNTGWTVSGATATNLSLTALGLFQGCKVTSAGATWHRLLHSARPAVTAGVVYSLSVWIILGTAAKARVILRNNTAGTETRFLFADGAPSVEATDSGTISGLTVTTTGTVLRLTCQYTPNYTGDLNLGIGPGSAVVGEDVTVLAAQFEQGSSATTYIATAGASATRAGDVPVWGAPVGTWDMRVEKGNGTVVNYAAQPVAAGWSPALPFSASRVRLFPLGTL